MGVRAKALLPWQGRTFLETIIDVARSAGAEGAAVVVGYHRAIVEPLAKQIADRVVTNPEPQLGMGSSAVLLARAIPEDCSMLLWPVDLPAVKLETVRAVLEAGATHPDRLVTPVFGDPGVAGHPPLLPPAVVAGLRSMPNESRLDTFLRAQAGTPLEVPVDDPTILKDVDAKHDLDHLLQSEAQREEFDQ